MAVVNELVTKFTFKGSLKPLSNFQAGLKSSIISIGKYGAALTALTTITAVWANSTLRGAEALVRLSQDTDISIEKLQKMQLITAQSGVSADKFEQSITSLSSKIGDAATQGSDDFNRLGISVRDAEGNIKSADKILLELTSTFKTLSKEQKLSFSDKLGIDKNIIKAFGKSNSELKKLMETSDKFGLLTEKQTKQLDNYYASVETLKFGFTAVGRQIALKFAPILGDLSEGITDFLAEFGTTFGHVFAEFIDGIGNLFGAFNKLIKATIGWKPILIGIGAAIAIAFPFTLIVAGVTGLLLVVEDLITAFSGGKSVIASFFKDAFNIDIVEALTDAFSLWIGIFDGIKAVISDIINLISGSGLFKAVGGFFDSVGGFFGGNDSMQPLAVGSTNNTSTQNMVNDIKIEVKTNDPMQAGQAVSSALRTELEQASFQFGKSGR